MAGCFPITNRWERADTVRPKHLSANDTLIPIQSGMEEHGDDKVEEKLNESDPWEEVSKKVEELEARVTQHFEDENEKGREPPPIIKSLQNQHRRSGNVTGLPTHLSSHGAHIA